MFDGAGAIRNDPHRKLPGDPTPSCHDDEEPSDRKISGLFRVHWSDARRRQRLYPLGQDPRIKRTGHHAAARQLISPTPCILTYARYLSGYGVSRSPWLILCGSLRGDDPGTLPRSALAPPYSPSVPAGVRCRFSPLPSLHPAGLEAGRGPGVGSPDTPSRCSSIPCLPPSAAAGTPPGRCATRGRARPGCVEAAPSALHGGTGIPIGGSVQCLAERSPVDLQPLVDHIARLEREIGQLTEAATVWQVRARQAEERLRTTLRASVYGP